MYTFYKPIVCPMSTMHTESKADKTTPRTKLSRDDVGGTSWREDNTGKDNADVTVPNVDLLIRGIRLLRMNFPDAQAVIPYLEDEVVWKPGSIGSMQLKNFATWRVL